MKRSYSTLNPKLTSTTNSPDTTNVTLDNERRPTFTTPPRTQEIPQPIYNSTPPNNNLITNSTFQRNIGGMPPNQYFNVLQTLPKYGDSVEIVMPVPEIHFSNRVDPSMPYFITSIPPTPERVVLTSALSQLGYLTMKECLNMHNIGRSAPNFTAQAPIMTPFCNNHVHNASQINQSTRSKRSHEACTQTVETIETQTEEEFFYESSGMPKKKRGRKKK